MLVLCVGMYRACSTWQYGVVGQLLERFRGGRRLGFIDGSRFATEVEPGLDPADRAVLKAHDAHESFTRVLTEGRALAIYSHRDLRDVALSWMHKVGASFEEILDRGFFELCLANDRFWRSQPGVLLQSYEDLIADPVRGVFEIAGHLGIEITPEEAREIADSLSLEANRKRTIELAERLKELGVGLASTDQDRYDRETLLHWNHVREGRAGAWEAQATLEQKATLARVCGPWLVERGYEPDLAWSAPPWSTIPKVSYAQNMEDILLDRLFRDKKGTFIDVGANHPTHNNNTYYYYLRGWRGVNVEPVRSAYQLFGDRRPEDLNLELAVSDEEGYLPFYEIPDCNGLSSLSSEMAEDQAARGFRVIERKVPTRTVSGLIEQFRLEPPDIFSIDVEGNEEKVLRGIPLDRWQPKVFVIEATRPMTNTLCHQAWEPILLEHGYLFAMFDGINRYYLRSDLAEALPLFDCPVNSLDFYERSETVEQRSRADSLQHHYEEERRQTGEARARLAEVEHNRTEAIGSFMSERDAWQRERDAWQQERDAVQRERDAWQQERDSFTRERDSCQVERDSCQVERDSWQVERDAVQRERDSVQRERDEVARRLTAQADEVRQLRDDFTRLSLARDAERARFDQDRQARTLEVEEARTQLRPYRLIDRFGVVTALHRRVRAHKLKVKGRS
jgi:FkbM family methyltransferase